MNEEVVEDDVVGARVDGLPAAEGLFPGGEVGHRAGAGLPLAKGRTRFQLRSGEAPRGSRRAAVERRPEKRVERRIDLTAFLRRDTCLPSDALRRRGVLGRRRVRLLRAVD